MPIHKIKLLERNLVAENTVEFTFEKPDGFTFAAGQYGGFTLIDPKETDEKGNTRRFSLLSSPDDAQLKIVTRIQNSAYKKNLMAMPLGSSEIKFAGPTGNFVLHNDASIPAVLIAGGIGIAPFYSMIVDTIKHKPAQQIILLYGNNSLASSAYMKELNTLQETHENFSMITALTEPPADWDGIVGFISDETIVKNVPDIMTATYYVCGSLGMVTALQTTLMELEIPDENIKVEDFPGY